MTKGPHKIADEDAEEGATKPGGMKIENGMIYVMNTGGEWKEVEASSTTIYPSTGTGPSPIVWSPSTTPPTTTTKPLSGGMIKPVPAKPKQSKVLEIPGKRPRKILIAFLGEGDEVEWCGKIYPADIDVHSDSDTGIPEMTLRFWLTDAQ